MEYVPRNTTNNLAIHCSASIKGTDIGVAEIELMHIDRGWSGIGYNQVIRTGGRIEIGRPINYRGAHVKGHNSDTLGICLVGGLLPDGTPARRFEDGFDEEQGDSLYWSLLFYHRMWPNLQVGGHRDFSPDLDGDGVIEEHEWLKACPCFNVWEWVRDRGLGHMFSPVLPA